MTRLQRKEAELAKLYEYKAAAMRNNDLLWLGRNQAKIDELAAEIKELKERGRSTLKALLDGRGEEFKNMFYKRLLRISLLAAAVNEACEQARELLDSELGVKDFSLRREVDEMHGLSLRIADFAIVHDSAALFDCMVDSGRFVEKCISCADAHLKRKLKL